jgi:hypothetical protein
MEVMRDGWEQTYAVVIGNALENIVIAGSWVGDGTNDVAELRSRRRKDGCGECAKCERDEAGGTHGDGFLGRGVAGRAVQRQEKDWCMVLDR